MISFSCLFNISTVASAAREAVFKKITENKVVTRVAIFFIMVNLTFFAYELINYLYQHDQKLFF